MYIIKCTNCMETPKTGGDGKTQRRGYTDIQ